MSDPPRDFLDDPLGGKPPAAADAVRSNPAAANRLGIGHLLLWMTATAAVMALFQPSRVMRGASDVGEASSGPRTDIVLLMIVGPALGAGVAAVPLCIWRLITRRFGFPAQPGHWLLLMVGAWMVIWMMLSGVASLGMIRTDPGGNPSGDSALFGYLFGTAMLASAAVSRLKAPTYWRVALGLIAGGCYTLVGIMAVIVLVDAFSSDRPDALGAIVFVTLLLAVLTMLGGIGMALLSGLADFVRRSEMDLFHWAGVIAFAVVIGVPCMAFFLANWRG